MIIASLALTFILSVALVVPLTVALMAAMADTAVTSAFPVVVVLVVLALGRKIPAVSMAVTFTVASAAAVSVAIFSVCNIPEQDP